MEEQQHNSYNSKYLCKLLIEYRKPVFIILAIAALFAIVFSTPFFITPLYKSTAIIYPTSSNSISKVLISTTYQSEKDIMNFGEDEQTEQMLQVLNSNRVRDKVIERFDLMNHYDIKADSKYPYTKLNKLYDSRIKFRRTEYNAVKITVLDADAALAAQMANDITEIFDSTMNQMQKEVATQAFRLVEDEYNTLCAEMAQLEDSLNTLRRLGVFDYESQVEMLSQQLAIELGKGNTQGVSNIQKQLDIIAEYGGASYAINERLDNDRLQLSLVKSKYEEAKVDATEYIPHKFVVTSAFQAERKTYPVRWIIVTVTLLSTFLLLILCIVVFDRYKSFFLREATKEKASKNPDKK
ncbi:MAG: Wzz/FepE/Etk N-terminal domain-containing protein [Bacteroidales bacterium]|nr:Wzz/FepE/Etk N-terminal domain-containing protein [Bacteroidales bacterium]